MSGFLGRWLTRIGLGRAAVAFGYGALPSGSPPIVVVVPIVSVCGDTETAHDPRSRTRTAATCTASVAVEPIITGVTRTAPAIVARVNVSEC